MSRVELIDLTKDFAEARGRTLQALRGVNLTVFAGELLAVLGPSGSGKTTLLRLLAGLETPTCGRIQLDGRDITALPPHERDVAMVFQGGALYPHMTAGENIAFGLKLRGVARAEREQRARAAASALGLHDVWDRRPQSLSGGERQRVALARALVRRAQVWLMDEPLASLDTPLRRQLRAEILQLHRRHQATTVFVTHDQAEAMAMGDRVAVLHEGTLQQVAAPAELRAHPANALVAAFLAPD